MTEQKNMDAEVEKLAHESCGSKESCSECVARNSNIYFTNKESCRHFVYAKLKVKEKPKTAKERVEQELKELEEKQLKLGVFIENELFAMLTEEEQRLLVYQYRIMGRYAMILRQRLKIWREL